MNSFAKMMSWLGLLLGATFLLLQVFISVDARLQNGDSLLGALWFFLTFFTVLTNIGVVLVHFSNLRGPTSWHWIKQSSTRTMFAAAIFVVMLIYHFVLSPLWQPKGLFAVADIGLHYITPTIYLAWWVSHGRTTSTQYRQIPVMLLPPIVYLIWAMARGVIIGEYPYPFLDFGVIGSTQVGINIVVLFVGLGILFAMFIALEQKLVRMRA